MLQAIDRIRRRPAQDDLLVRSWARRVRTYDEVPEVYQPFFDRLPPGAMEPFPYTVLMPSRQAGRGRFEIGWLVLRLVDGIHVLEDAEPVLRATHFPIENIQLVERGSILLHAWITIRGIDADCAARSTTLRFNSVTEQILIPLIDAMRAPTTAGPDVDPTIERSRLDFLQAAHFKFLSYGRASIRPGARLTQLAFQPEIRSELFRLFGYGISRLETPAHIALLTDSELILIRDDDTQRWSRGTPHGAVWTYIPRLKITGAALSAADGSNQALTVSLDGGAQVTLLFTSDRRTELARLVDELKT